jgi:hypothetical protein
MPLSWSRTLRRARRPDGLHLKAHPAAQFRKGFGAGSPYADLKVYANVAQCAGGTRAVDEGDRLRSGTAPSGSVLEVEQERRGKYLTVGSPSVLGLHAQGLGESDSFGGATC